MNKIKTRILNKIYEEFWKKENELGFGIATSIVFLVYFGSVFGLYLKFIYRSI